MSLEKTASAIARAIFDRIERDGNIVLANLEEAALSVLAVAAERRKATMTEVFPFNRNPSLADMERRLVEATRREKEHQARVRATELMQYMIQPGPIANTLREYAIKQGLVPGMPRMTNAVEPDGDKLMPYQRGAINRLCGGIGTNSDSVKVRAKQSDGVVYEVHPTDVARDGRASS